MKNAANKAHSFSQVPEARIPRSQFNKSSRTMTTFDSAYIVPIYLEEVVPGDTFNVQTSSVVRMATPLYPVMDNIYLDTHFFYVPMRLLWDNFHKFHGAQDNPGDSTSYTIPKLDTSGTPTFAVGSIFDYMGLPTGVATHADTRISSLPLRAYNKIYNEWYRDQNLINSLTENTGDSADATTDYSLQKRGKRSDYFTSCLPSPQKSDTGAVSLPLGTSAPVTGIGMLSTGSFGATSKTVYETDGTTTTTYTVGQRVDDAQRLIMEEDPNNTGYPNIRADLTNATAATVDAVIEAFAIQEVYRRDARGGTRINEIILSHFGVVSPDFRLQRPELLSSNTQMINMHTVPQTSATSGTDYQGSLAAYATSSDSGHSFNKSFTEWGYILGLVSVRADLTYQQGLQKIWTRAERLDFYLPGLANLGEQSVLNEEIYFQGTASTGADKNVFGYQERWSEMRTGSVNNKITGQFRSTAASSLDAWHLAQEFSALPTLNQTFIEEAAPISRVVADAVAPEFIGDFYFNVKAARPMPTYSVPGMKAVL